MEWDKHTKPPVEVCPGKYCFHWVEPGGAADMTGRLHGSFEEALARRDEWTAFPQGGCACKFGVCTRLDPVTGDYDWYEPHEPALERDGLPWFYFIPSVAKLVPELQEQYLRESKALWGE
jgi:hypothetical protein